MSQFDYPESVSVRGRSIFKAALLLCVVALILIVLGYFPQDMLRQYVERRIQSALGPGSRISRMHVVPGRLSGEVYDLIIEGPTYRLTAPRARLVIAPGFLWGQSLQFRVDRKSTRLNSSHLVSSYAVFCLKKKNTTYY